MQAQYNAQTHPIQTINGATHRAPSGPVNNDDAARGAIHVPINDIIIIEKETVSARTGYLLDVINDSGGALV